MKKLKALMEVALEHLEYHIENDTNDLPYWKNKYSKAETRDLLRLIRLESIRISNDSDILGNFNYKDW